MNPGDEVDLPEPRLPDLRVGDQLRRRRRRCRSRCARRAASASTSTSSSSASSREDQADHHQLARRTRPAACSSADADSAASPSIARARPDPGAGRRDLHGASSTRASSRRSRRFPGMEDRTIILDGFSKTYAMTGWRLGYGVMPEALAEHVTRLMVNSNSCTAAFTQHAGIAALQGRPDAGRPTMVAEFQPPARRGRGRPEPAPRRLLPRAARRLLRLPQRQGARAALARDRRPRC